MIPPPAPACLRQASMTFVNHWYVLLTPLVIVTAAHGRPDIYRREAQVVG
jgi:hypothetical protein